MTLADIRELVLAADPDACAYESDSTGERTAQIATVLLGEYEYSLVFVGFEPQEWQKIVDSTDLSPYQN